jgi:hypothetical protein
MRQQKAIFLFLALVLPICIFLFLKFFGKNEFAVEPLYTDTYPDIPDGCKEVRIPYTIDDSVKSLLPLDDGLVIVIFEKESSMQTNQVKRLHDEIASLPVRFLTLPPAERNLFWKKCVFFLKESADIVMVDSGGAIRGQYSSGDREDIDRLLTEISIILKKY